METQTCPGRRDEPGPWEHQEHLDEWLTSRWTTDHEEAEKKRQEFRDKYPTGSISETSGEWLWDWGPPRTCSFCGSIHPDDAIRLVQDGWEVEASKHYKRYLNPPGTAQRRSAALDRVREGDLSFAKVPSVWTPRPPVKLYVMHFDEKQIKRFNEALEK